MSETHYCYNVILAPGLSSVILYVKVGLFVSLLFQLFLVSMNQ